MFVGVSSRDKAISRTGTQLTIPPVGGKRRKNPSTEVEGRNAASRPQPRIFEISARENIKKNTRGASITSAAIRRRRAWALITPLNPSWLQWECYTSRHVKQIRPAGSQTHREYIVPFYAQLTACPSLSLYLSFSISLSSDLYSSRDCSRSFH